MKCQYCNGTGEHINDANRMTTCEFCGGTGVIKPLTNEEYIRSCSSEELANLIYKIAVTDVLLDRFFTAEVVNAGIVDVNSGVKEAEKWLKETHYDSVQG